MPQPREDCQEESQDMGTQDLTAVSNTQATSSNMTEDPDSLQGTEDISETSSPST